MMGKTISSKSGLMLISLAGFGLAVSVGYLAPTLPERQDNDRVSAYELPQTSEVLPQTLPQDAAAQVMSYNRKYYKAGEHLPEITFADPDGKQTTLDDFKGKPVLLNLWATWCGPCVRELPSLESFSRLTHPQDLEVVAVSVETKYNRKTLKTFLESRGIGDFALYQDQKGEIEGKIALNGLPTTYLLGADGKILYVFEGDAGWQSASTQGFVDYLLTAKE